MGDHPRTRSNVKRIAAALLLATVLLPQAACTRFIIYPGELTATAYARQATALAGRATPASGSPGAPPATPAASPLPTDTSLPPSSTPAPTDTPSPTDTPDPTEEPTVEWSTPSPSPEGSGSSNAEKPPILYYSRAGDILPAVAARFGVNPGDITSPDVIPPLGLLTPNTLLVIPDVLKDVSPADELMPDSEIVYSPSAIDFDVKAYVRDLDSYLTTYEESRSDGEYTGAELVERVAIENSVNPRLLLSLLELQSHWVTGSPTNLAETEFPIGYILDKRKGLYYQLSWAVEQLNVGYYGWRTGILTELEFPDGTRLRLAPGLNAGTVAVQYLFAQLYSPRQWGGKLYSPDSLSRLHEEMFGNAWIRAQTVEPLYPPNLTQPPLELPLVPGRRWALTGGPHSAWGPNGALAALDFAPAAESSGCVESLEWVTAPAPGLVTRSEHGAVIIDLDGDGYEQTGWAILLMHMANKDRVPVGARVNTDDRIGHPSCEGGVSTGTHAHIARKYNGEWILADGPMPFDLGGWVAFRGKKLYQGGLRKGDQIVIASLYGSFESRIVREEGE